MAKSHGFFKDLLDRAVETGAPFVVRRRCNPHQLVVWLAIRFLLDVTDRKALGAREIAREAGLTSYPRVCGWIDDLVELELLEIVGHEEIRGASHDRPVYRIPWERLLDDSLREAEDYLTTIGRAFKPKPTAHEQQLALPMGGDLLPIGNGGRDRSITEGEAVTDGSQGPLPIGNRSVIDRSQGVLPIDHRVRDRSITKEADSGGGVTDRSQGLLPIGNGSVIDRSQGPLPIGNVGGKDGRREGGNRARAHEKNESEPRHPPPSPNGEWPLASHPVDLWRAACPQYRPIDFKQIAALVAEHDSLTGGHGLYWVGRAILSVSYSGDIRAMKAVKVVLDRWRSTQSYGSDTPAYERRKAAPDGQRTSPPDPSRNGTHPERRADADQHRPGAAGAGPPVGLKLARVAGPGSPTPSDAPDGGQ